MEEKKGELREYAIRTSGHGSGYVASEPERFNLTFDEAVKEVKRWRIVGDTIGGDAIVVHKSGKIYGVEHEKNYFD